MKGVPGTGAQQVFGEVFFLLMLSQILPITSSLRLRNWT